MLRFYTLILHLLQPLLWLFILLRSLKSPTYRQRLKERYGFYPQSLQVKPNGIVIHAASVGEVIAATPFIKKIQRQYPELAITLTTLTPTGSAQVKANFAESLTHVYLPYDLPHIIKRFIQFTQPKLCIVIETEIWPNLITQFAQNNIPFIIANARLSARSEKRYNFFKNALKPILQNINLIAAQDATSAQRYLNLGYAEQCLKITGNLKYDLLIQEELTQQIAQLHQQWKIDRPIWIAASTHEGEDEIILAAHRLLLETYPNLLLIIVPRHPERFAKVEGLIQNQGFSYCRRSLKQTPIATTQVMLGDTMGELMLMYGIANIAFVGGSLVPHGGHNPLEPLAFKLPVISGKHTFNFTEIFHQLRQVQAVLEVESNAIELSCGVAKFLQSTLLQQQYGHAGYQILMNNQGAQQRLLDLLAPYLEINNE